MVVPSKTPVEPLQTVCLFPVNYLNFHSKKPVQGNLSPVGAAGEGPRFHFLFFFSQLHEVWVGGNRCHELANALLR